MFLPDHPTISLTIPSLHDGLSLSMRVYHPDCLSGTIHQTHHHHHPRPDQFQKHVGKRRSSSSSLFRSRTVSGKHSAAEKTRQRSLPRLQRTSLSEGRRSLGVDTGQEEAIIEDEGKKWGRQVAVVAHPYAPLGGSYDDAIVGLIGGVLLGLGYVVATLNFRGVSEGRTSWTSKPEQADYASVVGFMAYYAHYLDFPGRIASSTATSTHSEHLTPLILQAGFSYGAIIVRKSPLLTDTLARFRSPVIHTHGSEIRLRAQHLAEQQNKLFTAPESPRKSLGMRVGGDEEPMSPPRKNREHGPRTSAHEREEKMRAGVRDLLARTRLIKWERRRNGTAPETGDDKGHGAEEYMEAVDNLVPYREAYLMVSSPIGFMGNLATMSFMSNPFSSLPRRRGHKSGPSVHPGASAAGYSDDEMAEGVLDEKLVSNPTLAIYGDEDGFSMLRRNRAWASSLEGQPGSRFRSREVVGAGHFWAEEGVADEMVDAVRVFALELLGQV